VDELHKEKGLAHPGPAQEAGLATARIGHQKVNHLQPGDKNLCGGFLLGQGGGGLVDGHPPRPVERAEAVNGLPEDVKHPPQRLRPHRHGDGPSRIEDLHPPLEARCGAHGDAAHRLPIKVLVHLHDQVLPVGLNRQGVENGGQVPVRKAHINHRPDNALDRSAPHSDSLRLEFIT